MGRFKELVDIEERMRDFRTKYMGRGKGGQRICMGVPTPRYMGQVKNFKLFSYTPDLI